MIVCRDCSSMFALVFATQSSFRLNASPKHSDVQNACTQPVPHKHFLDVYEQMSAEGASVSETH